MLKKKKKKKKKQKKGKTQIFKGKLSYMLPCLRNYSTGVLIKTLTNPVYLTAKFH